MVLVPGWKADPIPNVSLSAGALLALANLDTVARRTAIFGGASWMDVLVLAPGLHYQQAADELSKHGGWAPIIEAVEQNGRPVTFHVNNSATAHYLRRITRPGQVVTLDVGTYAPLRIWSSTSGNHATMWSERGSPGLGWISHVLYLTSPVLTLASVTLVVLLEDWWPLASIVALMGSRLLNVFIIKQRSKPMAPPSPPLHHTPNSHRRPSSLGRQVSSQPTEYIVQLGTGTCVLRGQHQDLQAVTEGAWLRGMTHVEGYLEAASKLIVYMVAAFFGNTTQAGSMVLTALLLATSALLALSNAHAKAFRINGRALSPEIARVKEQGREKPDEKDTKREGATRNRTPTPSHDRTEEVDFFRHYLMMAGSSPLDRPTEYV